MKLPGVTMALPFSTECDFCSNRATKIYLFTNNLVAWDQVCNSCADILPTCNPHGQKVGRWLDIGSDEWKVWAVTRKLTR